MADDKKKEEKKDEESKEEKKEEKEEKKEEKKEEASSDDEKEVEVPKKFQDLVKTIEEMSVLDLAELVKILEDKFGVSAAAPVAVAAGGAGGAEGGDAAEEKSEFNVELADAGSSKINVIKAVRSITGQGLKDAKDMVDGAPTVIKENVPKEEAEEMKEQIEEAGGKVVLK